MILRLHTTDPIGVTPGTKRSSRCHSGNYEKGGTAGSAGNTGAAGGAGGTGTDSGWYNAGWLRGGRGGGCSAVPWLMRAGFELAAMSRCTSPCSARISVITRRFVAAHELVLEPGASAIPPVGVRTPPVGFSTAVLMAGAQLLPAVSAALLSQTTSPLPARVPPSFGPQPLSSQPGSPTPRRALARTLLDRLLPPPPDS